VDIAAGGQEAEAQGPGVVLILFLGDLAPRPSPAAKPANQLVTLRAGSHLQQ
jgi:hypothetical protein